MKKILAIVLCVSIYVAGFAQDKKSAVHVSFVPPLSTNGMQAPAYTNAFSFNMLVGISKNETGVTFGGLANIIGNDATGVQFAGLYNYVGNSGKGLQFAGLTNISGEMKGVQFAGLLNTTKNISGLQFGGLLNVAHDVSGVQFGGLLNIAKNVSGVQFAGLINIAESSDYPIALINIIKNGEYGVSLSYDETGSTVAAFRSGGKYLYGILGVGYNHKVEGSSFVIEGGLGARIHIASWLRLNNELKVQSLNNFSDTQTLKAGYALMPSFHISPHFELFGGPSINYIQTDNLANTRVLPGNHLWKRCSGTKIEQLYIGYQVGVQYIF